MSRILMTIAGVIFLAGGYARAVELGALRAELMSIKESVRPLGPLQMAPAGGGCEGESVASGESCLPSLLREIPVSGSNGGIPNATLVSPVKPNRFRPAPISRSEDRWSGAVGTFFVPAAAKPKPIAIARAWRF